MDHHHHSDRQSNTTAVVVVIVIVGVLLATLTLALLGLGGFLYFRLATVQAREEAAQVEMAVRQYEAGEKNPPPVTSEPLRILAWNIESGGNDPDVIADQLGRSDIYALSEVAPANTRHYLLAMQEANATQLWVDQRPREYADGLPPLQAFEHVRVLFCMLIGARCEDMANSFTDGYWSMCRIAMLRVGAGWDRYTKPAGAPVDRSVGMWLSLIEREVV